MLVGHIRQKVVVGDEHACEVAGFNMDTMQAAALTYFSMPLPPGALQLAEQNDNMSDWQARLQLFHGIKQE